MGKINFLNTFQRNFLCWIRQCFFLNNTVGHSKIFKKLSKRRIWRKEGLNSVHVAEPILESSWPIRAVACPATKDVSNLLEVSLTSSSSGNLSWSTHFSVDFFVPRSGMVKFFCQWWVQYSSPYLECDACYQIKGPVYVYLVCDACYQIKGPVYVYLECDACYQI